MCAVHPDSAQRSSPWWTAWAMGGLIALGVTSAWATPPPTAPVVVDEVVRLVGQMPARHRQTIRGEARAPAHDAGRSRADLQRAAEAAAVAVRARIEERRPDAAASADVLDAAGAVA